MLHNLLLALASNINVCTKWPSLKIFNSMIYSRKYSIFDFSTCCTEFYICSIQWFSIYSCDKYILCLTSRTTMMSKMRGQILQIAYCMHTSRIYFGMCEKTHVKFTHVTRSALLWRMRWRRGRSRGETKYIMRGAFTQLCAPNAVFIILTLKQNKTKQNKTNKNRTNETKQKFVILLMTRYICDIKHLIFF